MNNGRLPTALRVSLRKTQRFVDGLLEIEPRSLSRERVQCFG